MRTENQFQFSFCAFCLVSVFRSDPGSLRYDLQNLTVIQLNFELYRSFFLFSKQCLFLFFLIFFLSFFFLFLYFFGCSHTCFLLYRFLISAFHLLFLWIVMKTAFTNFFISTCSNETSIPGLPFLSTIFSLQCNTEKNAVSQKLLKYCSFYAFFLQNACVLNYTWKLCLCVSIVHVNISETEFSLIIIWLCNGNSFYQLNFLLQVLIVIVKKIWHILRISTGIIFTFLMSFCWFKFYTLNLRN